MASAAVMYQLGESLKAKPLGSCKVPLNEIFNIGEEINSGYFGVVCKAYHKSNPEEALAVKIKDRYCDDDEEDAIKEVSMLLYLRYVPNVIGIVDFYINDDKIYVFQQLAGGGDVFDRLEEKKTYNEIEARALFTNVLNSVRSLHEHTVVHRDLKPENFLLRSTTNDTDIWLCDFGDARVVPESGGLTTFCGTPSYCAPEIIDGVEYREHVDMWSLGCCLYLLLSGEFPFGNSDEDPSQVYERVMDCDFDFDDAIWTGISKEAKNLISSLLIVSPKRRLTAAQASKHKWFTPPKDHRRRTKRESRVSWARVLEQNSLPASGALGQIKEEDDPTAATVDTYYDDSFSNRELPTPTSNLPELENDYASYGEHGEDHLKSERPKRDNWRVLNWIATPSLTMRDVTTSPSLSTTQSKEDTNNKGIDFSEHDVFRSKVTSPSRVAADALGSNAREPSKSSSKTSKSKPQRRWSIAQTHWVRHDA